MLAPDAAKSDQTFIKRVVGLAGDRLSVRDGRVVRNGVLQRESYIAPAAAAPAARSRGRSPFPVTTSS